MPLKVLVLTLLWLHIHYLCDWVALNWVQLVIAGGRWRGDQVCLRWCPASTVPYSPIISGSAWYCGIVHGWRRIFPLSLFHS